MVRAAITFFSAEQHLSTAGTNECTNNRLKKKAGKGGTVLPVFMLMKMKNKTIRNQPRFKQKKQEQPGLLTSTSRNHQPCKCNNSETSQIIKKKKLSILP